MRRAEAEQQRGEAGEQQQRRAAERAELVSSDGTELAPLLRGLTTGRPRRDPDTGGLLRHSNKTSSNSVAVGPD